MPVSDARRLLNKSTGITLLALQLAVPIRSLLFLADFHPGSQMRLDLLGSSACNLPSEHLPRDRNLPDLNDGQSDLKGLVCCR